MNTTDTNSLIERYLASVSEHLPARLRKDTVTEVRSLIQDALDDRSKAEGRPPDDAMVTAVLKEFGPPEKIVAPYLPEKYLIGPRLYPIFMLVIKIALPIIAVLVLLTSIIGAGLSNVMTVSQALTEVLKALGNSLSAVIQAFGNIVLIFAILQIALPEFTLKPQEWDPHSLKVISKPDKIKRGELIVETVFTFLALVIFNFYLDRVGIYNNLNGQWTFTPILTPEFSTYIPWLSLMWILTILLDIILLRQNSWNVVTRLFSILVSSLNIVIAISLMRNIDALYTLEGALGIFGAEGTLHSLFNQVLIVILVIVIISSAVKILQMIWNLVKHGFTTDNPVG